MILCRRFLVLAALMFWQGGFVFYSGVAVPVGRALLGAEQSLVTRRVTDFLNLAGAVALPLLAWDLVAERKLKSVWQRWRWPLWFALAILLAVLLWEHRRLEGMTHPDTGVAIEYREFRPAHRLYLWCSTAQWACAVGFTLLTLIVWRQRDLLTGASQNGGWRVSGEIPKGGA